MIKGPAAPLDGGRLPATEPNESSSPVDLDWRISAKRAFFRQRRKGIPKIKDSVAEGVGFEPTSDFRRCRFSRPVPSTARPPLQAIKPYKSKLFTSTEYRAAFRLSTFCPLF